MYNIKDKIKYFMFEERMGIKEYKKFLKSVEKTDMPSFVIRDIENILRDEEEHLSKLETIFYYLEEL